MSATTFINAQTANVGDTVEFHARGATRTGTVLEVKGIKALIAFKVLPNARFNDDGAREQWIRFNVASTTAAKSTGAKSKLASYIKGHQRWVLQYYDAAVEASEAADAAIANPAAALAFIQAIGEDYTFDYGRTSEWGWWTKITTEAEAVAHATESRDNAIKQEAFERARLSSLIIEAKAAGSTDKQIAAAKAKGVALYEANKASTAEYAAKRAADRRAGIKSY